MSGKALFISIVATVLGWGHLFLAITLLNTPDFDELGQAPFPISQKLKDGTWQRRLVGPQTKNWLPLHKISPNLIGAIISAEDNAFFSHKGLDYREIKEAIKTDLKHMSYMRGASTITQQVIKNLYLSRKKTIYRKIVEMIWAKRLEKKHSKSEILSYYLNIVQFGPGLHGCKQASQHYFGRLPSHLSPVQSAFLALMLPAPVKYYSYFEKKELTEWAESRVKQILQRMVQTGYLSEQTFKQLSQVSFTTHLFGHTQSIISNEEKTTQKKEEPEPTKDHETTE